MKTKLGMKKTEWNKETRNLTKNDRKSGVTAAILDGGNSNSIAKNINVKKQKHKGLQLTVGRSSHHTEIRGCQAQSTKFERRPARLL